MVVLHAVVVENVYQFLIFMNVSYSWRVYVKTKITRNLLNYLKLSHNGLLCN